MAQVPPSWTYISSLYPDLPSGAVYPGYWDLFLGHLELAGVGIKWGLLNGFLPSFRAGEKYVPTNLVSSQAAYL